MVDTTFGTNGWRLFNIGGPNESFFGAALSPDKSRVAAVGYRVAALRAGRPGLRPSRTP